METKMNMGLLKNVRKKPTRSNCFMISSYFVHHNITIYLRQEYAQQSKGFCNFLFCINLTSWPHTDAVIILSRICQQPSCSHSLAPIRGVKPQNSDSRLHCMSHTYKLPVIAPCERTAGFLLGMCPHKVLKINLCKPNRSGRRVVGAFVSQK